MGFLDDIEDLKDGEGLIHLSKVTPIVGPLLDDPVWGTLLDDYRRPQSPAKACAISIFNAALTHGRRIFVLTRDGVERLLRADPNWPSAPVFNTKHWPKYLRFMYERKMIARVLDGHVSIYELTFNPLLHAIPENNEHKRQAMEFVERYKRAEFRRKGVDFRSNSDLQDRKLKPYVPDPETLEQISGNFKFDFTDDDILGPSGEGENTAMGGFNAE